MNPKTCLSLLAFALLALLPRSAHGQTFVDLRMADGWHAHGAPYWTDGVPDLDAEAGTIPQLEFVWWLEQHSPPTTLPPGTYTAKVRLAKVVDALGLSDLTIEVNGGGLLGSAVLPAASQTVGAYVWSPSITFTLAAPTVVEVSAWNIGATLKRNYRFDVARIEGPGLARMQDGWHAHGAPYWTDNVADPQSLAGTVPHLNYDYWLEVHSPALTLVPGRYVAEVRLAKLVSAWNAADLTVNIVDGSNLLGSTTMTRAMQTLDTYVWSPEVAFSIDQTTAVSADIWNIDGNYKGDYRFDVLRIRRIDATDNLFGTSLESSLPSTVVGSGNTFDVSVANPAGIAITGLRLRAAMATPVVGTPLSCSVWITDAAGGHAANHLNAMVWRLVATGAGSFPASGDFVAMTLSNPILLLPGTYGMAIHMTSGAGIIDTVLAATTTYANQDLAIVCGTFATAPFGAPALTPRGFSGALRYQVGGPQSSAAYSFFGAGCPGSLGITNLAADRPPALGATMTVSLDDLPLSSAFVLTGFSRDFGPFGALPVDLGLIGAAGCKLRVSGELAQLVSGAGNAASFALGVPLDPALLGVLLFQQAVVPDPSANGLGLVLSDAAALRIGLAN